MLHIIDKKKWYFLFSLLVIIPGVISLLLYGLTLSIDFTGGTRIAYTTGKQIDEQTVAAIRKSYTQEKLHIASLQKTSREVLIRTIPIDDKKNTAILKRLQNNGIKTIKQESFETIGPIVGKETTQKAFYSVLLSSVLILLYIAYSFRKVPKPTSSWKFGMATIVALLHDVLVLLGIFSILGKVYGVEIDSLFITAVLTVMGFSVHDTIVVFDRIRENLLKTRGESFAQIVNDSILQTLVRSLNTSWTAILVLVTLLLFGGESIRWFIVALLIGMVSGTYSSIFNAAPLLVWWEEFEQKRKKR